MQHVLQTTNPIPGVGDMLLKTLKSIIKKKSILDLRVKS